MHGTTREQVQIRWEQDQLSLQPMKARLAYPFADEEQRKVARDAYVSWQSSRYSVPWRYAGKEVWVRQQGHDVEVRCGAELIARHAPAVRRHQIVTRSEHHEGIPLGNKPTGKTLIHIQQNAPAVEQRSLDAYESLAMGGAR